MEKRFARAEVRPPHTVERDGKVGEAVFRRISKHTKRPHNGKISTLRFATSIAVVDQQGVRGKLLGEGDGSKLAGAEAVNNQFSGRALDLQPVRRFGDPLLHNGGRLFLAEFTDHGRRDEYASVQCRQYVGVFYEDQIP